MDKQDIIDRYLRGEMQEAALVAFEQQMAADEELRADVELQREIYWALQYRGMREFLKGVETKTGGRTATKTSRLVYWLTATAVAACIAVAVFVLPPSKTHIQALGNSAELTAMVPTRSAGQLPRILSLIENRQYTTAVELINSELAGDNNTPQEPQTEQEQYMALQQRVRRVDLEWCLAVAYLRMGDGPQAKETLEKIAQGQGEYSHKAKSLLEQF